MTLETRSKLYRKEEITQLLKHPETVNFGRHLSQLPKEKQVKPITKSMRFYILNRDKFRCCACGRNPQEDGIKLEVDHKISRSKGGTNDPDNLWTLCKDCNMGKFDLNVDEKTG